MRVCYRDFAVGVIRRCFRIVNSKQKEFLAETPMVIWRLRIVFEILASLLLHVNINYLTMSIYSYMLQSLI